jgi:hypothetical protein
MAPLYAEPAAYARRTVHPDYIVGGRPYTYASKSLLSPEQIAAVAAAIAYAVHGDGMHEARLIRFSDYLLYLILIELDRVATVDQRIDAIAVSDAGMRRFIAPP